MGHQNFMAEFREQLLDPGGMDAGFDRHPGRSEGGEPLGEAVRAALEVALFEDLALGVQ